MPVTKKEIIDTLKGMTLLEINDLINDLKKEFNVSDNIIVNNNNASGQDNKKDETDGKKEVSFILSSTENIKEVSVKIAVIKAIKEITNLNLPDSKKIYDAAFTGKAQVVKEKISLEEAKKYKEKFVNIFKDIKVEIK